MTDLHQLIMVKSYTSSPHTFHLRGDWAEWESLSLSLGSPCFKNHKVGVCPSRSQPGCVLGEDVTVLLSFCSGGHGESEPESFFVWLDELGWQRHNREVVLGSDCQEGLTGQVVPPPPHFPLLISIFFDVLLSFDSSLP